MGNICSQSGSISAISGKFEQHTITKYMCVSYLYAGVFCVISVRWYWSVGHLTDQPTIPIGCCSQQT